MGVKYVGATRDFSGYGEAARHDIAALHVAGIPTTVKAQQFTLELADFGELGETVASLEDKDIEYDTVILHVTPNIFGQFAEKEKRIIGRVFWETDKLPVEFAEQIEKHCHEVWTGSVYNAEAIRRAGVTKPLKIIPQAIDTTVRADQFPPYLTAKDKTFSFYSIFEWTYRKNPLALLEAYWTEFENTPDVSLNIKTYIDAFTPDKRTEIDVQIEQLKVKLGLKRYAPLYLFRNLLNRGQMYRFHNSFDCFISAHRGEGWGLPQMEALLMGKPVISTGLGGIHEYLTHEKDAYLLGSIPVPVDGNNRNQRWYSSDQKWGHVEVDEIREAMRKIYENRDAALIMGQSGSNVVREEMSLLTVGEIMKKELEERRIA